MDITATAQRITFGLYLDGQRGAPPSDSVGEAVVGPLGLLAACRTTPCKMPHRPRILRA